MKLLDVLTTDQIDQLIMKTKLTKSKLENLYANYDLKVFDSDKELFDWLNEGECTWEDYLDQPLDELLERLEQDKGRGITALDGLINDRHVGDDRIYILDSGDKFVFIY